jgi:hypothetical protein
MGTLTLHVHQLAVDADLLLVAFTAARDSSSREALRVMLEPTWPNEE